MDNDMVAFMRGLKLDDEVDLDLEWNSLSSNGSGPDIESYEFRQHARGNGLATAYWWVDLEFNSYLQAGFRLRLDYQGLRLPDNSVVPSDQIPEGLHDDKYPPNAPDARGLVYRVVPVLLLVSKLNGDHLGEAIESEILPAQYQDWGNETPIIPHDEQYFFCQVVDDANGKRIEVDLAQPFVQAEVDE